MSMSVDARFNKNSNKFGKEIDRL